MYVNFRKIFGAIVISTVVYCFIPANQIYAVTIQTGEKVTIEKNTTIDESILFTGQTLTVDGTINGDLYCFGQSVTIRGDVNGDIICAAQTIVFSGTVDGNFRTGSQSLQIDGLVVRNLTSAAQNITMGESAVINGELSVAGQMLDSSAYTGGKMAGALQEVRFNGTARRDVYLEAETIVFGDQAIVDGALTYVSEKKLSVGKSQIAGTVTQKLPEKNKQIERPEDKKANMVRDFAGSVIWQSLFAFFLLYFFQKYIDIIQNRISSAVLKTVGYGFITLILPPIATLILIFTVIGIPLAIILICLYIIAFFVSRTIVAIYVGNLIMKRFLPQYMENKYLIALVGVIAAWIITNLPFIGGFIGFLALLFGLGGVFYALPIRPTTSTPTDTTTPSTPGRLIA